MDRQINGKALAAQLKKVKLAELESFIQGSFYRQLSHVPISPSRAASYIANPDAEPGDVVLLLAFVDGQLVAFRSIYAGSVQQGGERIRFGWCSGSWVHPGYRRKGFSKWLLKEAYDCWNGRLMFTNYAPESEELYRSSGLFHVIHQYRGARGYLFLQGEKLTGLVQKKWIPRPVYSLMALMVKLSVQFMGAFQRTGSKREISFEETAYPDAESFSFMNNKRKQYLFRRNEDDWYWVLGSPWISEVNREIALKYPFSAVAPAFRYHTVKVKQNGELAGLLIFSLRTGHLKSLYIDTDDVLSGEVVRFVKQFAMKHRCELVTVYEPAIARQLLKNRSPFIYVKPYGQKIYSTFEVNHDGSLLFRDGEGDYVFT